MHPQWSHTGVLKHTESPLGGGLAAPCSRGEQDYTSSYSTMVYCITLHFNMFHTISLTPKVPQPSISQPSQGTQKCCEVFIQSSLLNPLFITELFTERWSRFDFFRWVSAVLSIFWYKNVHILQGCLCRDMEFLPQTMSLNVCLNGVAPNEEL